MRVVRHGIDGRDRRSTTGRQSTSASPRSIRCSVAIDIWQGSIMSLILTGMGSDGTVVARTSSRRAAA